MAPTNHLAFTLPINPPGSSPLLTQSMIWQGLLRKIAHAQEFVPVISSCTVESESTDPETGVPVTKRSVVMNGNVVKETCKAYEPTKVHFWQENGSLISNIVSEGPGGAEKGDLWMTYVFEMRHEELEGRDVEGGLKEARGKELLVARMAVERTIDSMREMARDGRIK